MLLPSVIELGCDRYRPADVRNAERIVDQDEHFRVLLIAALGVAEQATQAEFFWVRWEFDG